MADNDAVEIKPLSVDRIDDFLDFFDNRAFADNPAWDGCYCYFPLHDPQVDSWSDRTGDGNRRAMIDSIHDGRAHGFLAYADDRVVGWCHAGPRSNFPTLSAFPGDGTKIVATPCFVVSSDWRGKGVATQLLHAAIEMARANGMELMEAGPRKDGTENDHNFRGPLSMYLAAGYDEVAELPGGGVLVQKKL